MVCCAITINGLFGPAVGGGGGKKKISEKPQNEKIGLKGVKIKDAEVLCNFFKLLWICNNFVQYLFQYFNQYLCGCQK